MKIKRFILLLLSVSLGAQSVPELLERLQTCPEEEKPSIQLQIAKALRKDSPQEARKHAEESLRLARLGKDLKREAEALYQMGVAADMVPVPEERLEFLYQARNLFRQLGDTEHHVQSLNALGAFFFTLTDLQETIRYYTEAMELNPPENRLMHGKLLNNRSAVYCMWGKYSEALADMYEALRIKEESPDTSPMTICMTQNNIGLIYTRLKDKKNALFYFQKALEIAREQKNAAMTARALCNTGMLLKDFKEYDRARSHYLEALEISRKSNDLQNLYICHYDLGVLAIHEEHYDSAMEYFQQAWTINEKIGSDSGQASALLKIGETYKKMNLLEKSRESLESALDIARRFNGREYISKLCMELSEVYQLMGDNKKSLEMYKESERISKEAIAPVVSNTIRNIQRKYATDKMQKEIERKETAWQARLRIIAGTAFLFFLLAAAGWWNRRRMIRCAGKMIREMEQELLTYKNRFEALQAKFQESLAGARRRKYEKSNLTPEEAETHLKALFAVMREEKPYLENALTLRELAEKVGIHEKILSQVINEYLGKNFRDFINQYRLEEAKTLLTQTAEKETTVLDIAYKSGFNSKSNFNTLFKKHFHTKPSDFKRLYRKHKQQETLHGSPPR